MKSIFSTLILAALLFVITIPSKIFASDTLVVYASGPSIDIIINNDTTAAGAQAHSVYKLVSLDTTYIFLGPASVNSSITVTGVLGSDGRPPCIQPGILSDGSQPFYLFVLNGSNTKGTFKNLYLTGLATDGTINQLNVNGNGALINSTADNINLYVDNVVFEDWPQNAISYSGDHTSIFVTNCKFRNMVSATQWYSGEGVRNTFNTAITDSMVMKYNTFLCINAYAACPVTVKIVNYFEFNHNTIIYNFQNPFWIFNVTDAKVNDNIFYGSWFGAISKVEYEGFWDQLWSKEIGSLIDLDSLDAAKDTAFAPEFVNDPNLPWLAEAKRKIEVKNNAYFWSAAVTNFWTAWNDTAHIDSVYTPTWMNTRTTGMFTDDAHWPGLVESGNMNVDPGFGSSIDQVLFPNTGSDAGGFQYFTDIRTATASTNIYGYQLQSVTGNNWIPEWPLPELADMQYSNAALKTGGTDGRPVGDPGWFTGGITGITNQSQLPNQFTLYDAYPNPFNPSTNIKFSIYEAGLVSLKVYNSLGQLVKNVVDNVYKAKGDYQMNVNMDNLPSGVYFYRLVEGTNAITKKMMLLK